MALQPWGLERKEKFRKVTLGGRVGLDAQDHHATSPTFDLRKGCAKT